MSYASLAIRSLTSSGGTESCLQGHRARDWTAIAAVKLLEKQASGASSCPPQGSESELLAVWSPRNMAAPPMISTASCLNAPGRPNGRTPVPSAWHWPCAVRAADQAVLERRSECPIPAIEGSGERSLRDKDEHEGHSGESDGHVEGEPEPTLGIPESGCGHICTSSRQSPRTAPEDSIRASARSSRSLSTASTIAVSRRCDLIAARTITFVLCAVRSRTRSGASPTP